MRMAKEQLELTLRPPHATATARPLPVRVIGPRRPGVWNALRELWAYRRYTIFFGRGLLTRRYRRAWLGLVWLPLRPALNAAAKLLVFGGFVGITAGVTPYPVYFLLASAAWVLFSESLMWSLRSFVMHRGLLRDVHVPRLVVIASAVVPAAVDFLIYAGLAASALLYYYIRADHFYLELTLASPLWIGAAMLLLAMLGIGLGLVTAAGVRAARDVRFGLTYLVSFAYFLTPVIYPFELIPDQYKSFALANPITGAIELFKLGLFPGEEVSPKAVALSVAVVVALWIPGLWLFQRREVRDW